MKEGRWVMVEQSDTDMDGSCLISCYNIILHKRQPCGHEE